ncbi:GH10655 [Drosophila grimshawi]|uniref:GH10655 n=1 Tax=Drosophila grimshawi TaxID=7222 RepID=B4JCI9_DROGR|nr:GH10655 [Drosophila grimshawi]
MSDSWSHRISYGCACFAGFSGTDCGHGPLCTDAHTNICQNGGTCKHIGDAAITCHCTTGYKGTKCEIPEIIESTQGCIGNASASNCHRACEFDNNNGNFGSSSILSGSSGYFNVRSNRNAARSGKTRYEVTMRLGANLTGYYRNSEREQLAGVMERQHLAV